ncbi:MAG: hypothetical protein DRJ03_02095 [Chloroflexi bacterium]|nr:MAG: hypothetical protein DRJ03_02095 [Chloroflexota bacterium]
MGREVRRVPKDWEHPLQNDGEPVPLFDGFQQRVKDWDEGDEKWKQGLCRSYLCNGPEWEPIGNARVGDTYTDYAGPRPNPSDYVPDWPEAERTHYQMYESVTEGTPMSPVFETPEELARWLADTGANACAGVTASYEAWLLTCRGVSAASAAVTSTGRLISGVEANHKANQARESDADDEVADGKPVVEPVVGEGFSTMLGSTRTGGETMSDYTFETSMRFRVDSKDPAGRIRLTVFCGDNPSSRPMVGELVLMEKEYRPFFEALRAGANMMLRQVSRCTYVPLEVTITGERIAMGRNDVPDEVHFPVSAPPWLDDN